MGTHDRDRETDDLYTLEVRAEEQADWVPNHYQGVVARAETIAHNLGNTSGMCTAVAINLLQQGVENVQKGLNVVMEGSSKTIESVGSSTAETYVVATSLSRHDSPSVSGFMFAEMTVSMSG